MNIVVVGQGAMGLLWYHHLSMVKTEQTQQNKISLLASNQGQALTASYSFSPFQKVSNFSDSNKPVKVEIQQLNYAQTADIKHADVILLCLKAYQVTPALLNIADLLPQKAIIVLAHNGMGTLADLPESVINHRCILAMLTTHGCLRTAPLTIMHTGIGQSDIGMLTGALSTNKQQQLTGQLIEQLTKQLNKALPKVTFHKNIAIKQWTKLAINCVINPLTALNNVNNGAIAEQKFKQSIQNILHEVVLVAAQEKVILDQQQLFNTVLSVAKATAKNSSSMRCDFQQKRLTEVDYINGYIHRLGLKYAIATPFNTKLWQQIHELVMAYT